MSSQSAVGTLAAPAKVNLTLRVIGRRSDGYHFLESLMVPISLCDRVTVEVGDGAGEVSCVVDGPEAVAGGDDNVAAVAARRVLEELAIDRAVAVKLTKHVPAGSGLGGGSSDAAAVLRLLPGLLARRLRPARLLAMAAEIGADVPFFLGCRPAVATGIGDVVCPVARFPNLYLAIAVPAARVSTAWAYEHALPPLDVLTSRPAANTRSLRLRLTREPISSLLFNDFERGVTEAVPDVGRLKAMLESLGAAGTLLSGSGSAVLGVFASERAAATAAAAMRAPDRGFAVRALRRRPGTKQ